MSIRSLSQLRLSLIYYICPCLYTSLPPVFATACTHEEELDLLVWTRIFPGLSYLYTAICHGSFVSVAMQLSLCHQALQGQEDQILFATAEETSRVANTVLSKTVHSSLMKIYLL